MTSPAGISFSFSLMYFLIAGCEEPPRSARFLTADLMRALRLSPGLDAGFTSPEDILQNSEMDADDQKSAYCINLNALKNRDNLIQG